MINLDKNKRYNLISLTAEEKKIIFEYLKENDGWSDSYIRNFIYNEFVSISYSFKRNYWFGTDEFLENNAKELF